MLLLEFLPILSLIKKIQLNFFSEKQNCNSFLVFTPSSLGLSSLGVPGVPWHAQILADQLTLFQPGGIDYAHLIATGTPGFSDLLKALE